MRGRFMTSIPPFSRYRDIIPDFAGFLDALHRPLPTHLRINRLKARPSALAADLAAQGVLLEPSHPKDDALYAAPGLDHPGNLMAYYQGLLHPQALTSCLAGPALGPEPGAFVLDMCASPGGKTAHLAECMENRGLILANDLHSGRHPALAHNLSRLGVLNAVITGYQGQQIPLRHRFEYVLADVPCSGEGRQRLVNGRESERGPRAERFPELQRRILMRGFDLLDRGGVLVYATCTYNPEENEAVVNHLLQERDAEILPLNSGVSFSPGITAWGTESYDAHMDRTARFYPHEVDSVGFFMARIGRSG